MTLKQMIDCARVGCAISTHAGFYTSSENYDYIRQLQSFSKIWDDYLNKDIDDLSIRDWPDLEYDRLEELDRLEQAEL